MHVNSQSSANQQHAPIAQFIRVDEAALLLTQRTGTHWLASSVIDCAARGELQLWGRIEAEAKLTWCGNPGEHPEDRVLPARTLTPLGSDDASRLLIGESTTLNGLDGPLHFPGAPDWFEPIGLIWRISDGCIAPTVLASSCVVLGASLERLIVRFANAGTAPTASADQKEARALPDEPREKRRELLRRFRDKEGRRDIEGKGKGKWGALASLVRETGIDKDTLGDMLDKAIEEERPNPLIDLLRR